MEMCENIIKTTSKNTFKNTIIDKVILLDGFG
jgi:hypothetical protein